MVSMILTLWLITGFLVQFYSRPGLVNYFLNVFAATRLPNKGMHRQAEILADYMNQHPQFLWPETNFRVGVWLMQTGQQEKAQKILELALSDQERFKKKWQGSPVPYRVAGQVLTLLGREGEAEGAFLQAVEIDQALLEQAKDATAEAWVRLSLGRSLLAMGDSELASREFSLARALRSDRRTQFQIDRWMRKNLQGAEVSRAYGY